MKNESLPLFSSFFLLSDISHGKDEKNRERKTDMRGAARGARSLSRRGASFRLYGSVSREGRGPISSVAPSRESAGGSCPSGACGLQLLGLQRAFNRRVACEASGRGVAVTLLVTRYRAEDLDREVKAGHIDFFVASSGFTAGW